VRRYRTALRRCDTAARRSCAALRLRRSAVRHRDAGIRSVQMVKRYCVRRMGHRAKGKPPKSALVGRRLGVNPERGWEIPEFTLADHRWLSGDISRSRRDPRVFAAVRWHVGNVSRGERGDSVSRRRSAPGRSSVPRRAWAIPPREDPVRGRGYVIGSGEDGIRANSESDSRHAATLSRLGGRIAPTRGARFAVRWGVRGCGPTHTLTIDSNSHTVKTHFSPRRAHFLLGLSHFV
jgi:hypothetical protein